jgi:hypothetical protein
LVLELTTGRRLIVGIDRPEDVVQRLLLHLDV